MAPQVMIPVGKLKNATTLVDNATVTMDGITYGVGDSAILYPPGDYAPPQSILLPKHSIFTEHPGTPHQDQWGIPFGSHLLSPAISAELARVAAEAAAATKAEADAAAAAVGVEVQMVANVEKKKLFGFPVFYFIIAALVLVFGVGIWWWWSRTQAPIF